MRKALGSILVMIAAPTIAAANPQPAPSTPDDGNKIICKTQKDTGTRFPKKKCMTKAQWAAMVKQQEQDAKEMLNGPVINPPGD